MSKGDARASSARANPAKPAKVSGGKAGYHHKNLRNALIESGKQLLESSGLPGFSLRMAARTAGVSQTAPYHHFPDKDGLLAAMAADGFQRLATDLEAVADGGVRPLMLAFLRFAKDNPQMFRLMFATDPAARPPSGDLKLAFDRCWSVCAAATRRQLGEGDESSPKARQATLAVWSGMYGLARLLIDAIGPTTDLDDERAADAVVDIFQRGLGPAAPSAH